MSNLFINPSNSLFQFSNSLSCSSHISISYHYKTRRTLSELYEAALRKSIPQFSALSNQMRTLPYLGIAFKACYHGHKIEKKKKNFDFLICYSNFKLLLQILTYPHFLLMSTRISGFESRSGQQSAL